MEEKSFNYQKSEILEKAWSINPSCLLEPYFADTETVFYGTRGQVKKEVLHHYESMETTDGGILDFLSLRVMRNKMYDKYMFRGKASTKEEIDYILKKEQRDLDLKELLKLKPNAKAFIYNGSYGGYWGWNRSGYTSDKLKAGVYDLKEAINIVIRSGLDRRESIEIIDIKKHNSIVKERIRDLEKCFIHGD